MASNVVGNMALQGLREVARGRAPDVRDLLLTPRNVQRIANDLARMRGAAMKVGQLVSMDTGDMLPPELADIMARLRADADFMPPAQLKRVLNKNWGEGWLRKFRRFDVQPIAAASIGQVHRAETRDGRDLAIKVQYPGVAQSIDSDVANVGALVKVSGLLPKGLDLAPYMDEARKQLHEEADYIREGQCLRHFGTLLANDPDFMVPDLHDDLTTPSILAMSYIDSSPIEDAVHLPPDTRNLVVSRLLRLTLRELFEFRFMQTDPNFANYRYHSGAGRVVLLDFGATRPFSEALVGDYRRLICAGLEGDYAALASAVEEIGFVSAQTPSRQREAVFAMIGMVFDAIGKDTRFDFASTDLMQRLNEAGSALAADDFIPPPVPMDALFLQRKFAGMFLLGDKLGASVPLRDLLEHYTSKQ